MNTQSHISAFDTTFKTMHEWLRELQQLTGLSNQAQPYALPAGVREVWAASSRLSAHEIFH